MPYNKRKTKSILKYHGRPKHENETWIPFSLICAIENPAGVCKTHRKASERSINCSKV